MSIDGKPDVVLGLRMSRWERKADDDTAVQMKPERQYTIIVDLDPDMVRKRRRDWWGIERAITKMMTHRRRTDDYFSSDSSLILGPGRWKDSK